MGAYNQGGNLKVEYYHMYNGKFENSSFTQADSLIDQTINTRVNKNGNTVYCKQYNALAGIVRLIEIKTFTGADNRDYEALKIFLSDDSGVCCLSTGSDYKQARDFYNIMENIQINKPLILNAWTNKEGRTTVFFKQEINGKLENVPTQYYYYDNKIPGYIYQNNCPAPQEIQKSTGKEYNFYNMVQFFKPKLIAFNAKIEEKFGKLFNSASDQDSMIQNNITGSQSQSSQPSQSSQLLTGGEDDLPF